MPEMSRGESMLCRSAPWRAFASRVALPWATNGVTPRGDVLEIGAGSGAMAEAMTRRWPDVRLVATDFDPAMVAMTRARLPKERATADVVDATALPYGDATFDTVASFAMLHHTLRWEAVLAECARVLRTGGVLVGYDLVDTRFNRAVHVVDRSPYRLAPARDLRRVLCDEFTEVRTSRALLGHVVRFRATR